MTVIDCTTERPGEARSRIVVRTHELHADLAENDTAPNPHDYFDSALATCKALTAMWYAKRNNIPLERVESHIESDASEERAGKYKFRIRLTFHGPIAPEDRKRLYAAVSKCPIHKLMTTAEVSIETEEMAAPG